MTKTNLSTLTTITVVCGCCAALFALALPIFFITGKAESIGNYGSFIGGLIGTILSFVAVILVYQTYRLQEQELKETRDQLKNQQFESTFFNMLNIIYSMGKELDEYRTDFFEDYVYRMRQCYDLDPNVEQPKFLTHITNLIDDIQEPLEDKVKNDLRKVNNEMYVGAVEKRGKIRQWMEDYGNSELVFINWIFEYLYKEEFNTKTSHYFRYMYNTFTYVLSNRTEESDRIFYINQIQALLSSHQLAVLFYNCISDLGLNKNDEAHFKNMVATYGVIDRVDDSLLMNPDHRKLIYT